MRHLALAHGTAVKVAPTLIRALRDGTTPDETLAGWRDFLVAHGVEAGALSAVDR